MKGTAPSPRSSSYARLAVAGIFTGVILTIIDQVWGGRTGSFALWLLAVGLAAALVFEFLAHRRILKYPRRLDSFFVGGADYAQRKDSVKAAIKASVFAQLALAGTAGLVITGLHWNHPSRMIGMVLSLFLESIIASALFWVMADREWFSLSRENFSGLRTPRKSAAGGFAESALLRHSRALAAAMTGLLPHPYGWLVRRKLLFLFRQDPVSLVLYLAAVAGSGIAFHLAGTVFMLGFFALIGCMVTLTLSQSAWMDCDRFSRECAYLFPPRRQGFRCDLAIALTLASAFGLYFSLTACLREGFATAFKSQSLWQMWVTMWDFAGLILVDAYTSGRTKTSRAVLGFCYLGIAGVMFMFPGYGLAAAAIILVAVGFQCRRLAIRMG